MTPEEQLRRWCDGESVHNGMRGDPLSECCPDFSCCKPSLLQPVEVRRAFLVADEAGRERLLMTFLGAMLAEAGSASRVHIAGKDEPQ